MKGKIVPVLALLFVLAVVPATFAQGDNVTAEDERDLRLFDSPIGAQYRFLQLQLAITKNVLTGTEVVDVLQANHPDGDYTELNLILDDMESLLNEVKAYEFSDKELNTIAEDFVTYKKEAVNLTREFRAEAAKYLTNDDRNQVRERVRETVGQLSGLIGTIDVTRRDVNAFRMGWFFGRLGVHRNALTERIRNGNATYAEVMTEARDAFRQMNMTHKIEAAKNLTAAAVKRDSTQANIARNVAAALKERLRERNEWLEQERERKRSMVQQFVNRTARINSVLSGSGAWAARVQSASNVRGWQS